MTYKQIKPFNQRNAGRTAGYCLRNVRMGYGIDAKYPSAWDAWHNTEQHKNRSIPTGVAVPLYYDYTDSKGNRYGHINVRLADGRIWNDGQLFANLRTFEKAFSNVKYVGWGESVNSVRVIKEEEELVTTKQYYELKRFYHGLSPTSAQLKRYVGKISSAELTKKLKASPIYKDRVAQAKLGKLDAQAHLPKEIREVYKDTRVQAVKEKIINFVKGVK